MSLADELRAGEIPTEPGPWVRSKQLKASFTPGEVNDLKTIAEDWGVPVGTVVWAIVHDQLSRYRRKAPEYGRHGITIAAAVSVLPLQTDRRWHHTDGARAKAQKAPPECPAQAPGFHISDEIQREIDERLGRSKEPDREPTDQPFDVPEVSSAVTARPPRSNYRALHRLLSDPSGSIE